MVLLGRGRGLFKEKSAKPWGRQRFTRRDDWSPTQSATEAPKKFQNLSEAHGFKVILLLQLGKTERSESNFPRSCPAERTEWGHAASTPGVALPRPRETNTSAGSAYGNWYGKKLPLGDMQWADQDNSRARSRPRFVATGQVSISCLPWREVRATEACFSRVHLERWL